MLDFDQGGRARGQHHLYRPPSDLAPYVEQMCALTGQRGLARPGESWRIVPDASAHLIWTLTETPLGLRASLRLVGARSIHRDVDVTGRTRMRALRFRPGALGALVGADASDLTDRAIDADLVFGRIAARLADDLADASDEEAFRRLGRLIAGVVTVRRQTHFSRPMRLARALAASLRVETAAAAAGISTRALHQQVLRSAGLPPKRLMRVERMHRALALMLPPRARRLDEVAIEAGYADQAHLTRESRRLLGETPRAFCARGSETFKSSSPSFAMLEACDDSRTVSF